MRAWRRLSGPIGLAVALGAAAIALHLAGTGSLASPPLAHPERWPAWLDGRDPVVAAFALLRVVAVGALWYLTIVTAAGILLRVGGTVRMVALADLITIAPIRRVLAGTVGLGLAATGVLAVAAPAARLRVAVAAEASPTTTIANPRPGGTVIMHQLSPTEAGPIAGPGPASAPPIVAPSGSPAPVAWTVAPGECFWSVAERVQTTHLGYAAADGEIVPYWRRLIEANRANLAHPDNPDLIFPGQVFELPPP